jgi:hypothetical protein
LEIKMRKYVLLASVALAVVLAGGMYASAQMRGHGSAGGGMQEQAGSGGMHRGGMGHGTMGRGMQGRMGRGGHMGGHGESTGAGGHGMGHGRGMGPGHGGSGHGSPGMRGMMGGSATAPEMQELHAMFVNHDRIKRSVTNLPNGIRTVTESDDPELTKIIVSHVAGMLRRVDEGRNPRLPIQSPHLEVIFRNKDKIKTSVEHTPTGIAVTQTSDDAETVVALQKHAADVDDLVRRGMAAAHETMMRNTGQTIDDHATDHGGPGHGRGGRAR